MVKSTSSSRYSVFEQAIPDKDLKKVRHYLQFKTRLEGMELFLEQLKRDANRKEIRASECFAMLTYTMNNLMQEFAQNQEIMQLAIKYNNLVAEYDDIFVRKCQLESERVDRQRVVDELVAEYNSLSRTGSKVDANLDKKMELGQKIKSLKLDIGVSIDKSIEAIDKRRLAIYDEVREINEQVRNAKIGPDKVQFEDSDKDAVQQFVNELKTKLD